MENYFFRLVCVDEQNPIRYSVLEDETIETLQSVHDFVKKHINDYPPELTKWILLPCKKYNCDLNKANL